MPDTFAITIIFIVLSTITGAFIKGRSKDKCLINLSGYPVTLQKADGKTIWGNLRVENSGIELVYSKPHLDEEGHTESSYILYKNEYDQIKTIIRYAGDLDPALAKKREASLEKTKKPNRIFKLSRRIRNFFGTVRDSLMEVVGLAMGRIKTSTAGQVMQGQDKYVTQMQQQAIGAITNSYEPILERYLGKKIVLSIVEEGKKKEYPGILKEYTTSFIEVMGTRHTRGEGKEPQDADMIVPRTLGIVRHAVDI
jgi:hypothetical protein